MEWTVESPYDKENNQSGNVEISNQGAFSSGNADGWSQIKKDKKPCYRTEKVIHCKK